ncbi:unnamed protein product [Lampetra fluviatilis]
MPNTDSARRDPRPCDERPQRRAGHWPLSGGFIPTPVVDMARQTWHVTLRRPSAVEGKGRQRQRGRGRPRARPASSPPPPALAAGSRPKANDRPVLLLLSYGVVQRQTTDVRNGNKRRQSAGESLRRFPSGLSMGGRQSTAHPIGRATSVLQNLGEIEKPGRLANPRLVFRADGQHGTPGPAASEREPPGV